MNKMFSVQQKREIAESIQQILAGTNHPELPSRGEISFSLHVEGAEKWSWADIKNNGACLTPSINLHNENGRKRNKKISLDYVK